MDSEAALLSTFEPYVASVEDLATAALRSSSVSRSEQADFDLLDGQAAVKLRDTTALDARRSRGAFFSGTRLRSVALAEKPPVGGARTTTLDPAVGAGDLLIEVARRLPVVHDLVRTLHQWGLLLHGRDLEPVLVRLAKARLVMLAVSRGATTNSDTTTELDEFFPQIRVGDGLELLDNGRFEGHVVMNPPFKYHLAGEGTAWASGRTNLAATFLAAFFENAQPGTQLTAILPDVIRTGSRYARLRSLASERIHISSVKPFGQFDKWTDVDVFVLRGMSRAPQRSTSEAKWWPTPPGSRIGDKFDVHVGPVVPHRDLESGSKHPYLHARSVPLGGEFDSSNADAGGFQRRLFSPPFVLVRRTSRPGDKSRGVGTVVVGSQDVLVENHLIVLKPKDGSIGTCRRAADLLGSKYARQWLDERIRCRHLTVRALRELPWFDS